MLRRLLLAGAGVAPYLDELSSQPRAALGLKKLVSTATLAIRVRRGSDDQELDIGFLGKALDVDSLVAFAGSGNAYVRTAYDQSGNGNDAGQATASLQPLVVSAGSYLERIKFDGVDDFLQISSVAMGTPQLHAYLRAYMPDSLVSKMLFELTSNYAGGTGGGALFYQNDYLRLGFSNSGSPAQRHHRGFNTTTNLAAMARLTLFLDRNLTGSGEGSLWVNGASVPGADEGTVTEQVGSFPTDDIWLGSRPAGVMAGALELESFVVYNTDTSLMRTTVESAIG